MKVFFLKNCDCWMVDRASCPLPDATSAVSVLSSGKRIFVTELERTSAFSVLEDSHDTKVPDEQGKIIDSFQKMLMETFQSSHGGDSQCSRPGKGLKAVRAISWHWTQIGRKHC